jgi:hypothetical protein
MKSIAAVIMVACLLVLLVGCAPEDPVQSVLKERRLWKIDLLSFLVREDGKVSAQFRLTGPVKSSLERLTVRIEQLDLSGQVLAVSWNAFDISDVSRGGPVDQYLVLDAASGGEEIESLRVDPMLVPEPSDIPHIPELQGLETAD